MAELRQTFRPEFLNRIDDIIVFRALTEQDIEEVARRMLKTVAGRMEAMDIHLDASDEAVKELAKEGFDPRYGARPLRRHPEEGGGRRGRGGRKAGCHQVIIPWKFLIHT